jgi:hypothetical protein
VTKAEPKHETVDGVGADGDGHEARISLIAEDFSWDELIELYKRFRNSVPLARGEIPEIHVDVARTLEDAGRLPVAAAILDSVLGSKALTETDPSSLCGVFYYVRTGNYSKFQRVVENLAKLRERGKCQQAP